MANTEATPEFVEPRWLKGDWAFDKAEDPDWDDPDIPRLRLSDDEYEKIADAVVKKQRLEIDGHEAVDENGEVRFCALDLRKLVDAVQVHPDVRLARATEDSDGFLRPDGVFAQDTSALRAESSSEHGRDDRGTHSEHGRDDHDARQAGNRVEDKPTLLALHGCVVLSCDLAVLDIGCTLQAAARFAADASFEYARFAAAARFEGARFAAAARFWDARFAADAWFGDARFAGSVRFNDAEINRRLLLSGATFGPDARLDVYHIVVRAGASLHLDTAHLNMTEPDSASSKRRARQESDAVKRWAGEPFSVRVAFVQYYLEAFVRWIDRFLGDPEIPLGLGLRPRGRLIEGEDSDDKQKLAEAAEAYNLLRDIFRAQPSTDAHEEICAIRHHDLVRRARERPRWWSHVPGVFHWLIMRNALGYLMNPWRPIMTGGLLIVLFTVIYWCFIGIDDISHGAFMPVADGEGGYVYPEAFEYWNSDLLNPLYLSLMTFVTLGYGDFQPAAGWLKLVTGLEGILGVTLLALFTVAWGRKMVR